MEILNVAFDNLTRRQALERLLIFLNEQRNHILCTPNPEMVLAANDDAELMEVLKGADMVVPDGIGVVLASRLQKHGLVERVAGCDLIYALFDAVKTAPYTVYMLGGKPGIVELAAENMRRRFSGLKIVGHHHGYFDEAMEAEIISDITRLKPDILLAGLGAGRQEKWLWRNKGLPVRLSVGVGGSLDVMSGTVKRAPLVMQKMGLEWLYRLVSQPSRAGRMLRLPEFVLKVIINRNA